MDLPNLPLDKANHFVYGAVIGCVISFYNPVLALAVVVTLALLKEVSDALLNRRATGNWHTGPHGVELLDAAATAAGGIAATAPAIFKLLAPH